MSKQIELHLHYPLVAHTWDLNAFCTTNAKRNLSIFSQTPVLCRVSFVCCGLYMPDQKDILPRARGRVAGVGARWGRGRARFLPKNLYTMYEHTTVQKKLRLSSDSQSYDAKTCAKTVCVCLLYYKPENP